MMNKLHNQSVARAAGYPASLFGFTPDQHGYWLEPGLPWVNGRGQNPYGLRLLVDIDTDEMAPRFPNGAAVGVENVAKGQPFAAGLYVWKKPEGHFFTLHMGRLLEAQPPTTTLLSLHLDNRPHGIICLLEWQVPGFALYRVTHYASLPTE